MSVGGFIRGTFGFIQSKTLVSMEPPVSPQERLHAAIDNADLQEVESLLTSGISINSFLDGQTPMARAVQLGSIKMVNLLLSYKPNLHLGSCAYASRSGRADRKEGNIILPQTVEKRTPLLLLAAEAGDAEIVRMLLENGSDPNDTDTPQNQTALHIAAKTGNKEIVHELLRFDSYVNRLDVKSNSPLHHSVLHGWTEVTKLLLQAGALVNLPGGDEVFPLHTAVQQGHGDMVALLLEYGALVNLQDHAGWTALHHSAARGDVNITRLLLRNNRYSADYRGDDGETALSLACEGSHLGVVKELLVCGQIHPNLGAGRGSKHRLPIQIAAAKGTVEILELLLKHGALVNQRDVVHGQTALHWAVLHHQPITTCVLLQNGANTNIPDAVNGQNPLHIVYTLDNNGSLFEIAHMLIKHKANINLKEKKTLDTPLHIVSRTGSNELLNLLLEQPTFGISLNELNRGGDTPLLIATRAGHHHVVDIFLKNGCNLTAISSKYKETALHIAMQRGFYGISSELLRHGAFVNHENANGETPLSLLINQITETNTGWDSLDLLYKLIFLGAKCGKRLDIKSTIQKLLHGRNSNHALPAAILALLQPLSLFSSSLVKVRNILLENTEGQSILSSVSSLPLPHRLKQYMILES